MINADQYNQLLKMINQIPQTPTASYAGTSLCLNFIKDNIYIIDSRVSDHIICDPKYFRHKTLTSSISVRMPNINIAPATHIGTIHLSEKLILKYVLFVIVFHFNLISVSTVCTNNSCLLNFRPNTCEFQDPSTEIRMGLGRVNNGLYYWTPDEVSNHLSSCITNKSGHCNTNINKNSLILHQ